MNISFRYALRSDLPAIVKTYNATIPSLEATADLKKVSLESKVDWFEAHNKKKRPLWIVLFDKQYAGWLSFNSFYGRPAYDGTVEVSIYLEEHYRGRGLGKACLEKAIQEAPNRNIHTLLGFVFAHNKTSLALFKSFDFKSYGHLPKVANMKGSLRDLIILGKKV